MSIKICVIAPTSHLREYSSLGDMEMCLAHLVLENPEGPYAQYYKEQSEKGRHICLDNSLFELSERGIGLGVDAVLDAASIINPTEIIATDVLFDGPATVESTKAFIEKMRERGVLNKYQVMAVPQGKTKEEWMECLDTLHSMFDVHTIGLSKLSVPMCWLGEKESNGCVARSRLECTEWMEKECFSKPVHLLGGDNWLPWELKQQTKHRWIRSNDSSAAVWYGAHIKSFDEEGRIEEIILEKPDLENISRETAENCELYMTYIQENIIRCHQASKR